MVLEYLASLPQLPVIFLGLDLGFCCARWGHFKRYKFFLAALPGWVNILAGISDKDTEPVLHPVLIQFPCLSFPCCFLGQ